MAQPPVPDGLSPGDANEVTVEYRQPGVPPASDGRPCNVALPGSTSGQMFAREVSGVLRQRLLIATLITATGFTIFFVRSLIDPPEFLGFSRHDLLWQGLCNALVILIATTLASPLKLSLRWLRGLELLFFGTLALYFAWIQVVMFHHGRILDYAVPEFRDNFLRLANVGNSLRWFMLIVIYGVFVPNTWKRCALFTAVWAGIPLVMMTAVCLGCPVMGPHMTQSLFDMLILLGVASAIAVFGSYKISALQQEAIHARRLGQYQLKERLGSGGMGEVFLGEHLMLRRACAVKLIHPEQSGDGTSVSRFEREVKAMATLTHWNAVEVYDYGRTGDGTFYYVMEYLPGMSLQQLVERHGPLSPARTVHFLRQLCGPLQEAHSIGLIHRDVKPSNVIVCERGGVNDVAKLLDFGLVQRVGLARTADPRLTVQGMVLGSPPYMSPEQAMGKEELDGRSDIYSVGALAYFLLTGQSAFERDTPMQVLMAHVYDPVTPLSELRPDVPADLEEVILRCLSKNPADRFPDADSLEQALAACACADQWTRHDAADWWRAHAASRVAEALAG